jgi:hypothetical protein
MPNHSYVTSRPNYQEKFQLDNLENEKVTHAVNELYSEGLIDGNENYAELTKNGILEVKILTWYLKKNTADNRRLAIWWVLASLIHHIA